MSFDKEDTKPATLPRVGGKVPLSALENL